MESYNLRFLVTDFHLARCFQGSPMVYSMYQYAIPFYVFLCLHSFLWLNSTLLYGYTTLHLSTHQ